MTSLHDLPLHRLRFYLTAPYACSYLPDRLARSQVATPMHAVDTALFSELAQQGFRRSGQYVYRPRCDACDACVSSRLPVHAFRPDRSQRRCQHRNADLETRLKPLQYDETHFHLYRRYQTVRHAGGGMDEDGRGPYEGFLLRSNVDSALLEYSLAGRVVMVSLIDRLLDGLSAVYAFYEPELSRRSLGVFNVLTLVELARRLGLSYVYLGYWIEENRKMTYKARFRPIEGYRDGQWRPLDAPTAGKEGD